MTPTTKGLASINPEDKSFGYLVSVGVRRSHLERHPVASVTNWHFSRSFHFYFIALTLVVIVQSLNQTQTYTLYYPFRLLTLFQTIKENQKQRVYSVQKRSQHNARTTTDGPFQNKAKQQDYLIVRQNDRTRNPFQDRRIGTIAHQRTNQGIAFQGVHRNAQLQPVERRAGGRGGNPSLDSEHRKRTINHGEERVTFRQVQALPTPQNYFRSHHSRRLHRQGDPLGGSGSG